MPVPASGPAGAVGPGLDRPQGLGVGRPQGLGGDRPQRPAWDGLPGLDRVRLPGLDRALGRWAGRLGEAPAESDLDDWRRAGIRLVCARVTPSGPATLRSSVTPARGGCGSGGAGTSVTCACAPCRSSALERRPPTARPCARRWPRRWPSGDGRSSPAGYPFCAQRLLLLFWRCRLASASMISPVCRGRRRPLS
jgi:hypothetical protein